MKVKELKALVSQPLNQMSDQQIAAHVLELKKILKQEAGLLNKLTDELSIINRLKLKAIDKRDQAKINRVKKKIKEHFDQ